MTHNQGGKMTPERIVEIRSDVSRWIKVLDDPQDPEQFVDIANSAVDTVRELLDSMELKAKP